VNIVDSNDFGFLFILPLLFPIKVSEARHYSERDLGMLNKQGILNVAKDKEVLESALYFASSASEELALYYETGEMAHYWRFVSADNYYRDYMSELERRQAVRLDWVQGSGGRE